MITFFMATFPASYYVQRPIIKKKGFPQGPAFLPIPGEFLRLIW
jgi:hypothetical protein